MVPRVDVAGGRRRVAGDELPGDLERDMVERDLSELLHALGVEYASSVIVHGAPPEWTEASELGLYPCAAASADVEIAITEREADVLLAAGAATGESQPFAGD